MSDLLVPLLTAVVGVILSALIAYPLGRVQGRQQTLYEEQVKIISEVRKLVLEIDEALWDATHRPDVEPRKQALNNNIAALDSYHQEKRVWLYPPQNAKITAIIKGYGAQAHRLQVDPLSGPDVGGPVLEVEEHKAALGAGKWASEEGRQLVAELEAEARNLLGTDQRPFWQRIRR